MNKVTWLVGCLMMAPVVIGIASDDIVGVLLSLVYGLLIAISPRMSATAHRFWRKWHRENFRIINQFR